MITIQPKRFGELLSTDANFILKFIIGHAGDVVADRLASLGMERPVNEDATWQALQDLLEAGHDNEFVQALSVPLVMDGLQTDQVLAVYQAVPVGTTPNNVAKALALNALRIWKNTPPEAAATNATPMTTTPTPTPEEKRKRIMQALMIGLLAIGTIVGIAVLVRLSRN